MKYKKDEMVSNVSVLDEKNNDAADKKESSIILKLIISFFTGGGFSTLIGKMVGEKGVTEVIRLIDSTPVVVVVFLICLTVIICILINRIFEIKKLESKSIIKNRRGKINYFREVFKLFNKILKN